jgi:hypothetical protein
VTLRLPVELWEWLILVFGAYRLTRLAGWDDLPPIVKARAWILGERWTLDTGEIVLLDDGPPRHYPGEDDRMPMPGSTFETETPVPGKQPSTEAAALRPAYDRPTLAHLVHCPFCLGWWVSLAVYAFWLVSPSWSLYTLFPWALSGLVGLIARNLD